MNLCENATIEQIEFENCMWTEYCIDFFCCYHLQNQCIFDQSQIDGAPNDDQVY